MKSEGFEQPSNSGPEAKLYELKMKKSEWALLPLCV